ncbi:MAG: hypothetical protein HYY93_12015 [Planctomycetes bacterium]|nr:hypothetical protein [Planctomycetota bacterium]
MGSVSMEYPEVPPGVQELRELDTAQPSPLSNVKFICGGRPDVIVLSITGDNPADLPFLFNPDGAPPGESPFDVTRYFAQNPQAQLASTKFTLRVDNRTGGTARIHFGVLFS